jgi:methanogenic corrinoid protein MtbC1
MDRSCNASSSDDAPAPEPESYTRATPPAGDTPGARWLDRFVAHDLVPRLLDPARAGPRRAVPSGALRSADVEVLVELLLAEDLEGCVGWIEALQQSGIDADRLCGGLIAPAACSLGERWDQDRCDFAQVSIALGRLQALVHRVGAEAPPAPRVGPTGRVMILTLPARDHLLGAVIVADAFRRAGWDVSFEPGATEAELLRSIGAASFDLLAVSVALERDVATVRALLGALRKASLNPSVRTMAGGAALRPGSTLTAALGVDLIAADARDAVALGARALRPAWAPTGTRRGSAADAEAGTQSPARVRAQPPTGEPARIARARARRHSARRPADAPLALPRRSG